MRNEHTALPWKVEINVKSYQGWCLIYSEQHGKIAEIPWHDFNKTNDANARFIVTACNSHDELVELLELAFNRFTDNDMMPPNYELSSWLGKAKQALTKVKEV